MFIHFYVTRLLSYFKLSIIIFLVVFNAEVTFLFNYLIVIAQKSLAITFTLANCIGLFNHSKKERLYHVV